MVAISGSPWFTIASALAVFTKASEAYLSLTIDSGDVCIYIYIFN